MGALGFHNSSPQHSNVSDSQIVVKLGLVLHSGRK